MEPKGFQGVSGRLLVEQNSFHNDDADLAALLGRAVIVDGDIVGEGQRQIQRSLVVAILAGLVLL